MEALRHAADRANSGHGQIVAAVPEAGLASVAVFLRIQGEELVGWMVLEAFSVSHGIASAYLPVIDLLHTYFD